MPARTLTQIRLPETLGDGVSLALNFTRTINGNIVMTVSTAPYAVAGKTPRAKMTRVEAMAKARAARWAGHKRVTPVLVEKRPCRCVKLNADRVWKTMHLRGMGRQKQLVDLTKLQDSRISAMLHPDFNKRARALHRDVRAIALALKTSPGKIAVPYMTPHKRCRFE